MFRKYNTRYHSKFKMNGSFLALVFLTIYVSSQFKVSAKLSLQIVNGTTAEEGEFPYAVELRESSGSFLCGGSIIAPEWILTAGHCISNLKNGSIVYGTTKFYDSLDGTPNTSIAIKQLYRHPNFTYITYSHIPVNDVGILQLAEPISFNEYAQPIKIAEDNTNIPFHVEGVLSGWGGIKHNGESPSYLQKINLQLLSDDECIQKIDDYGQDNIFNSTDNLCSNDYYNGGCYGDSGSPYVINGTQYGLISWSLKPCYGVVPNTYTRLSNPDYRNWIRKIANV